MYIIDIARRTALHYASTTDRNLCALLLSAGCDVDAADNRSCTALHYASASDCSAQLVLFVIYFDRLL